MDSKKYLSLQNLKKSLLDIYKKNKKEVFDLVIFGSLMKGKENAEDIDVAVIFYSSLNTRVLDAVSGIDKKIHADYLILSELYGQPLWLTLIKEGYSIAKNKKLSEIFGLKNYGLYTYNLTSLGKRKSRFSQVLMGYKADSILKKVSGEILKPGVILIPMEYVEYFREFLDVWKVKYRLKYVYSE